MSIRHLDALFRPASIAIIGPSGFRVPNDAANANRASAHPADSTYAPSLLAALPALLAERIASGGYAGVVQQLSLRTADIDTPCSDALNGVNATVITHLSPFEETPAQTPELALICAPAADWERIVRELIRLGTRAAILFGETDVSPDAESLSSLLAIARPGLLRLIGPASAGIVSSRERLHASVGNDPALPGRVALISQSRSFANAVVSWASARDIGFSKVITSGQEIDVDCADLLDYLASDPATGAIALAIDFIAPSSVRKFMSAARAASRNKPVLVLRARHRRNDDALFSAAFRRAGMVRVDSIEDLLDAIETLHMGRFAGNDAVTILSNGGFTGALGADAVTEAGSRLAVLNDDANAQLSDAMGGNANSGEAHETSTIPPLPPGRTLPVGAKRLPLGNPLNLGESADLARYGAAIDALAGVPTSGALFVIHTPSLHAPALPLAELVVEKSKTWPRALMSCWLGDYDPSVRALLHRHKIAVYPTPQRLARAFARMREYQHNQILLAETPESIGHLDIDKIAATRQALRTAIDDGISDIDTAATLNTMTALLVRRSTTATSASASASASTSASTATAGKASGGSAHSNTQANNLAAPPANQVSSSDTLPLGAGPAMHISIRRDALFGMVLGVTPAAAFPTTQAMQTQWAILPISTVLSADLVARLPSAPAHGHASHRAFTRLLARLSDVIVTIPEISTLTLTAAYGSEGIALLDGRIGLIAPFDDTKPYRFAVRPYPAELESTLEWAGEAILIRPIKPQDEDTHRAFIDSLSEDDMRMRFFGAVRTPEHSQLARMTQIDYDREMAFIATSLDAKGQPVTLGVVRAVADPDNDSAEFAVVVRSDRKGLHLGGLLMRRIIEYCRARQTGMIIGEVLSDNTRMIRLARGLGFTVKRSDEPGVMSLTLALRDTISP